MVRCSGQLSRRHERAAQLEVARLLQTQTSEEQLTILHLPPHSLVKPVIFPLANRLSPLYALSFLCTKRNLTEHAWPIPFYTQTVYCVQPSCENFSLHV